MIQVGDKVVCVDTRWNSPIERFIFDEIPVINNVYVVSECYTDYLRLIGVKFYTKKTFLGIPYKGPEGAYEYRHFRKLEDVKEENAAKAENRQKV